MGGECVVSDSKDYRGLSARFVAACLVAASMLLPGLAADAQAQRLLQVSNAKRTVLLNVAVGKTEDVRTDTAFVDITVGDPEVADVNPLTDRSLSILGKKVGTTRVTIYGEGKKLVCIFDVDVTYDVSRLSSEIARIAHAGIKVSSVNGRVLLSGTSPDAVTLDRAVTLARQFAPDVINSVLVSAPQQVMMEVRFIEVSRNAGRALGVQWNMSTNNVTANVGDRIAANQLPVASGNAIVPAAGVLGTLAPPFGVLLGRMVAAGATTDVIVNALEERGMARSLAEPNLVALSGDTASFLAGGEYPIPVAGTQGQIAIEYKRYGVGLSFTPTVLRDGLINIKIEPEVSQFDPSRQVAIGNGIAVPALIVRRASTTVELRDGQGFVIGGLLQDIGTTTTEQLPWLGDVPVLGALFRSASYQKRETDLAIIVTPRLVRPTRPGDPIKTPLDSTLPANDADLFLLGKAEVTPATARLQLGADRPFVGHVLDMPKAAITGGSHVLTVRN